MNETLFITTVALVSFPLAAWFSPRMLTWIAAQAMSRRHAIMERKKAMGEWLKHLEGEQDAG